MNKIWKLISNTVYAIGTVIAAGLSVIVLFGSNEAVDPLYLE